MLGSNVNKLRSACLPSVWKGSSSRRPYFSLNAASLIVRRHCIDCSRYTNQAKETWEGVKVASSVVEGGASQPIVVQNVKINVQNKGIPIVGCFHPRRGMLGNELVVTAVHTRPALSGEHNLSWAGVLSRTRRYTGSCSQIARQKDPIQGLYPRDNR